MGKCGFVGEEVGIPMGSILKTAKAFLTGATLLAVFSLLPGGYPLSGHAAAIDHSTTARPQNCPVGCASTQTTAIKPSDQNPEEEKDEDPAPSQRSYYVQFLTFIPPKNLGTQNAYGISAARPPDLVKLYANYRF